MVSSENAKHEGLMRAPDHVTEIAAEIRSRILAWKYAPGTRLLERQLSNELGVSRSPMREALRMLEARGFLEKTPNRGYQVRQLDVRTAHELYELREAIECFVVRRLARRKPSTGELAEWRAIWSEERLPGDASRSTFAAQDRAFHEALAAATDNATLLVQLTEINDRIDIFRAIDFEQESTIRTARQEHMQIIDAIEAGDEQKAEAAMRENIEQAKRSVRRGIGEALARAYLGDEGEEYGAR